MKAPQSGIVYYGLVTPSPPATFPLESAQCPLVAFSAVVKTHGGRSRNHPPPLLGVSERARSDALLLGISNSSATVK